MVKPEVIRATVDAYIEAARTLDVDRYASLLAPDAVRQNPSGRLQGRQAIRDSAQLRWSRLASVDLSIERLIVTGASVAFSSTARMTTHDGRTGTIQGIDVLDINEAGQIEAARMYYDPAEVQALLS